MNGIEERMMIRYDEQVNRLSLMGNYTVLRDDYEHA